MSTSNLSDHTMSSSCHLSVPSPHVESTNDEPSETRLTSCQDISGRHISPFKLLNMLRCKFGVGSYEIQESAYRQGLKNLN